MGVVVVVDFKLLQNCLVINVLNVIQGFLFGVMVIFGMGQLGSDNIIIWVCGVGILNNFNLMYVVDGLLVFSINEVDFSDIENILVLKDVFLVVIYGLCVVNGVILIIIKKGGDKVFMFCYDGYVGWQKFMVFFEYLYLWEYVKLYNKVMVNEGKNLIYIDEEIEKFRNGLDFDNYLDIDWQGLFYKIGLQYSYCVEILGGMDKMIYMFFVGYLGQDGIIDIVKYDCYLV